MGAKKIAYDELKEARKLRIDTEIHDKFDIKTRCLRDNESLKRVVLTLVTKHHYSDAVHILQQYPAKYGDFIEFQMRVEPYVSHCVNLVQAIEVKRNFPQVANMPMVKQHELMDKVIGDFNELRMFLVRIEAMNSEVVYKDILSMKILIRIGFFCALMFSLALMLVSIGWAGPKFINAYLDETTLRFTEFLYDLFL